MSCAALQQHRGAADAQLPARRLRRSLAAPPWCSQAHNIAERRFRAQNAFQCCGRCAMKPLRHSLPPDTLCQIATRIVLASIHFLIADHPRYCMPMLVIRYNRWINLNSIAKLLVVRTSTNVQVSVAVRQSTYEGAGELRAQSANSSVLNIGEILRSNSTANRCNCGTRCPDPASAIADLHDHLTVRIQTHSVAEDISGAHLHMVCKQRTWGSISMA